MFKYDFPLSKALTRDGWKAVLGFAGWFTLFLLVVVTAVHAVSLVMEHTTAGNGVMWLIRLFAPVLTEVIAALVAVGFAVGYWKGSQKLLAFVIEAVWVVFAGLNMLASFATESMKPIVTTQVVEGVSTVITTMPELPEWLFYWLHYGLPVSGLISGVLFYATLRLNPDHQREGELKAAEEAQEMQMFSIRQEILRSPQMLEVLRNKAWLETVKDLKRLGFDDHQVAYMTQAVPELQVTIAPPSNPVQQIEPPKQQPDVEQPRPAVVHLNGYHKETPLSPPPM